MTIAEDAAAGAGAWAEDVPDDPKACSGDHQPLILRLHALEELQGG